MLKAQRCIPVHIKIRPPRLVIEFPQAVNSHPLPSFQPRTPGYCQNRRPISRCRSEVEAVNASDILEEEETALAGLVTLTLVKGGFRQPFAEEFAAPGWRQGRRINAIIH